MSSPSTSVLTFWVSSVHVYIGADLGGGTADCRVGWAFQRAPGNSDNFFFSSSEFLLELSPLLTNFRSSPAGKGEGGGGSAEGGHHILHFQ